MEDTRKHPEQISWRTLWRILRRRWWVLLLVFVVVSLIAGTVAYTTHHEEYTATAKLWAFRAVSIDPSQESAENDYAYNLIALQSAQIGEQLVDAYKEILLTDEVLNRVIEQYYEAPRDEAQFGSRLALTKPMLKSMVQIESTGSVMVFDLSITVEERPYDAELIANIWSEEFCDYVKDLMGGQELVQTINLPRISDATTPGAAVYSNPISVPLLLLIGLAGAVLVYAIFLIAYITDDKIKTPEDVKVILGLNLLSSIPVQSHMSNVKWTVHGENDTDTVEFKK